MCGILAIVNKIPASNSQDLINAASIIRHRGPDDEGFMTWNQGENPTIWAGADTDDSTLNFYSYDRLQPDTKFRIGFGHRRLSIVDLSPGGHQPMVNEYARLAICFNGEIYNYLEIRDELYALRHQFNSSSDTEVILHAWEQWGPKCLEKFNGMFAFTILDYKKNQLYVVRDRFGVKPVFYYSDEKVIYIASEIKQIRSYPDFKFRLNEKMVKMFLATGAINHTNDTLYANVKSLECGHYMRIDLNRMNTEIETKRWYTIPEKKWKGNYNDAAKEFRKILTNAVKLRLRSDVKVGSCLSGGLDSSSIVCLAADLLKEKGDFAGQETVTACYADPKFDEWKFADEVIKKTGAHPHRTFPSFNQLMGEIDQFIWHQDAPTGSTSQFSQWAVFKATHEARLKVMIDGQGADEQLAGYGGNDIPFYTGLLTSNNFAGLLSEINAYKKAHGNYPKGFLIAAAQVAHPFLRKVMPKKLRITRENKVTFIKGGHTAERFSTPSVNLSHNLKRQMYLEPLPALLRYEDHNSMAWSVESRTPFLDVNFVEFTFSLPERFIYKNGVRKQILRDAMHGVIPEMIENRKDKMGFVTPEELWLKQEGTEWFRQEIDKACKQFSERILEPTEVKNYLEDMIAGKRKFDFVPWRIICFAKWYNMVSQGYNPYSE